MSVPRGLLQVEGEGDLYAGSSFRAGLDFDDAVVGLDDSLA